MLGLLLSPMLVALVAALVLRRSPPDQRRLVGAGLAAHVAGAVAIVLYHEKLYRGGDMLLYRSIGAELVRVMERDSRYVVDVVKLALHLENDLPLDMFQGTSSGTMCAVMAFLVFVLGNNLYAICLVVSMFAFVGQWAMYRAVSPKLEPVERQPVLTAFMVIPSVVFWSSGFIKEAFVVGLLGLLCWGILGMLAGRLHHVVTVAFGLTGISLMKPYILFPTVIAASAWVYAMRPRRRLGLGYKLLGLGVAIGGLFVMSALFPEYAVDRLAANVSQQQRNYDLVAEGSGSNIDIGQEEEYDENPSLLSHLKYFPLALVNALIRPFLFEARSPSILLAAIEMTVVLYLLLSLLRKGSRAVINEVVRRPPLMFAAVFVLSFCVAVGLATRNLGTLSRYRVPAMPLYVGLLAALRARLAARAHATSPAARAVRGAPRRVPLGPRNVAGSRARSK